MVKKRYLRKMNNQNNTRLLFHVLNNRTFQKGMEQPLDQSSELGIKKGLVLMLDAHSDILSPGSVDNDFEGFTGLISPQNSFPMIGYNGFRIKPGVKFANNLQETF